jgi:hypothetical protein
VRKEFLIHAALAALIFVPGPQAFGQEATAEATQSAEPPAWAKSPWSAQLTLYLWTPSISGDVGVGPLPPAEVDIDFDEIWKSLDWSPPPIMLTGEVRYDRVAFFGDFIYLGNHDERALPALTADVETHTTIFTFGGSYRVVEDSPITLDLLGGARLWMLDADLALTTPLGVLEASRGKSWFDPIVGISGQLQLGGGFALKAEGDVGGFGVGADLDWQVLGVLQYQVNELISLEAGYRYLAVDYDSNQLLFDVAIQGPIIGGSLHF